jgi:TrmH family RNA methyltransferase
MLLPRSKEKELRSLSGRHGRKKADIILIEGVRAIGTMLDYGYQPLYLVISDQNLTEAGRQFRERLTALELPIYKSDPKQFAELADTEHSQGFLAIIGRDQLGRVAGPALETAKLIIYLDGINDPGNLGTIIRTAAAFGAGLLVQSPDSVDFGNPKVVRASAGTVFALSLLQISDPDTFFTQLESKNVKIVAADANAATTLEDLQLTERVCIVLGAEAAGLSNTVRARSQELFRIRTVASVESLNVAAAAAIVISQISERMQLI